MLRFPRPLAVGLQTSFRIMREALSLTGKRQMFGNVTNPVAPVSVQTIVFALIFAAICLAWIPTWIAAPLLFFLRKQDVPILRDFWIGVCLCFVAKTLL